MDYEKPRGYPTPEDAALAGFPSGSRPRVVRVEKFDDTIMWVYVDTEPSHLMRVSCERRGELWYDIGDIVA